MHWKFDPFFSIEILHGNYPPPTPSKPAPRPPFLVEPTGNTQHRLFGMGWVFKPYLGGGGGTLYAEKAVAKDGSAKLKVSPAQDEGFTFHIRLTDASLLEKTIPYDAILPTFSGRARTLYFDNLNAVAIGADNYSLPVGNAVGLPEFASRMPTNFMFRAASSAVTQVTMASLKPSGISTPYPLNTKTNSVEINLPENGYRLTQLPVGTSETLFLTDETLPSNTLGVLRIFKPPGADWEPFRRYQIMFDKKT